jgi:hypothetical protein
MKISRLIPEHAESPKRLSLVRLDCFVQWLKKNKPDVIKEAGKSLGVKELNQAFDDLGVGTELYRP